MDQKALRDLEARCVQEEPPRCRAACPLGLDARALCAAVAAGDMAGAWAVLRKHMPLPGVLARICDHPCEAACLRGQAGEPIRIGALERAAVNVPETKTRVLPMPKRPGRVAVTGSGLASLAAAWDLAAKGLAVTVLTGPGDLGGRLAAFPESLLPRSVVAAEIERLEKRGVVFRPCDGVAVTEPEALLATFDAVCLGGDDPSLPVAMAAPTSLETMALETPGLFACGLFPAGAAYSPIQAAAEGRRAALSADRFLQKVSLTVARPPETQPTRLFTNLDGVAPLAAVPLADPEAGYAPGEAKAEAGRCLNCQCLECVKACSYLEAFKAYPKVYARRVYNNLAIVKGHHTDNILINSCMLCGLCTALCPEGFSMADLCLSARREMVTANAMPPSAHEFALRDMEHAQGGDCALIRPAPDAPNTRGGTARRLFFPGCQLSGLNPRGAAAAYQALRRLFPAEVGIWLSCCGAPARWAGREDLFQASMDTLRASWEALGKPEIVTACPACLNMLERGLPEAAAVSLWEVFDQAGLAAVLPEKTILAPLDPCTARNRPDLRQSARNLLTRAGAQLVEPPYSGERCACCGFGGLVAEANPTLAQTVAERRAHDCPEDYAAYCAMCRDRLASTGKRVLHLLDILFPGEDPDPAAAPAVSVSARRDNRAALKRAILGDVYQEALAAEAARLRLVIAPETAALLNARRILEDDLRQTVAQAEASKAFFRHAATGHRLAGRRLGNVTFWAEYAMTGEGCVIHNAYSHRMRIKTEGGGRQ